MHVAWMLMVAASVSVEAGWQPLEEGGYEYTISIEPELLDALRRGSAITSVVPPHVDVRRYRIVVGRDKVARIDRPRSTEEPASSPRYADGQPSPLPRDTDWPMRPGTPDASTLPARMDAAASPPGLPFTNNEAPGTALPATHNEPAVNHNADKPTLPESARPWLPLAVTGVLLCFSLGGNIYLGWIAAEARRRYRSLVQKAA